MPSLRKPSPEAIEQFLEAQRPTAFSYSVVGATATNPPAGYVVDHTRVKLGDGEQAFLAAQAALERWEQFRLGWMELWPSEAPIQTGEVVAVVARAGGLWWFNACRIVYVTGKINSVCRFGLAYGTLAEHAASDEERFLIECDLADDSVWYDILGFSKPRHVLAQLGYSLVRRLQKRFAAGSAAMQRVASPANSG